MLPCTHLRAQLFDSQDEEDDHKEAAHWYCRRCRKPFSSQNALTHHLRTHLPKRLRCPGRGCTRLFALPADLVMHFESGACPSGVTRADVDRAVVEYDPELWTPDKISSVSATICQSLALLSPEHCACPSALAG